MALKPPVPEASDTLPLTISTLFPSPEWQASTKPLAPPLSKKIEYTLTGSAYMLSLMFCNTPTLFQAALCPTTAAHTSQFNTQVTLLTYHKSRKTKHIYTNMHTSTH
jgi:hypothetical protein